MPVQRRAMRKKVVELRLLLAVLVLMSTHLKSASSFLSEDLQMTTP